MDTADVLSLGLAGLALVIALVSAWYTARNARANERRLRGETVSPRRTRFELDTVAPPALMRVRSRMREGVAGADIRSSAGAWEIVARNVGGADAVDVTLTVKDRRQRRRLRGAVGGDTVTVEEDLRAPVPAGWKAELDFMPSGDAPLVIKLIDDKGRRLGAFDVDAEVRWRDASVRLSRVRRRRRVSRRLRV